MSLNTVTLKWDLTDLIEAGLSATLSITPTAQLSDSTDHILIPPVARRVVFSGGTGQLAGIIANDNSSLLPAGTGYLISVSTQAGVTIVPQFQTQLLFSNGATQWLDALAVVPSVTTSYQYLPLPSGTPQSGQVPVATGAGEASAWGNAAAGTAVAITTLGSTFSPSVTLAGGSSAVVTWTCAGFSPVTGLTPTLNFGTSATRTVYMTVADAHGYDAIGQVTVFNLGFDHTQDNGMSSLSSSYDWPAQNVSAVSGVSRMSGLQVFACNAVSLTGTLDFSGMAQLQHVECFGASVQQVFTAGCMSLIRLCVEVCKLTTLDLNPTLPNLLDLRAAVQQGGSLALKPIGSNALQEWHFCVRDQTVTGMPDFTKFPALQQLWIWNTGQSGSLVTNSSVLNSVQAFSNSYTSANFAGQLTSASAYLDMHGCALTSITLTGCTGLTSIYLANNNFSQSAVDGILNVVNGFGTSGGIIDVSGGGNAAPSGTGMGYVSALRGRGWTVLVTVSVVQSFNSVTYTLPGAFASNVTAGNTVFLVVTGFTGSSGTMSSSAPTLGGSPVSGTTALFNPGAGNGLRSPLNAGTGNYTCIWMLPNCPGGSSSLGLTTAGFDGIPGIFALEVAGLGAVLDKSNSSSTGSSGATVSSGSSGNTTAAPEIIIGISGIWTGAAAPGAPWTTFSGAPVGSGSPAVMGYQIAVASGGAYTWTQTPTSTGQPAVAGVVTVK